MERAEGSRSNHFDAWLQGKGKELESWHQERERAMRAESAAHHERLRRHIEADGMRAKDAIRGFHDNYEGRLKKLEGDSAKPEWHWALDNNRAWTFSEIFHLLPQDREQLRKDHPALWQAYVKEAQQRLGVSSLQQEEGRPTVEILNLVEGQAVGYQEMIKGYVDPPDAPGVVEVRVFDPATKRWNPSTSSGRSGSDWHATCLFGSQDASGGIYEVVALLCTFSAPGPVYRLPEGVAKSTVIRVVRAK